MQLVEKANIGSIFTFPKSKALRFSELLYKRDLRKNLVVGSPSGYIKRSRIPNKITKAYNGMKFNTWKDIERPYNTMPLTSSIEDIEIDIPKDADYKYALLVLDIIALNDNILPTAIEVPKLPAKRPKPKIKRPMDNYDKYTGYSLFNAAYDKVEQEMPEAKKYRSFLTKIAEHESGFKPGILNSLGAPAYGYFLFMEGTRGTKEWHNILKYAGTDIETFKLNPELLIKAAIKLAKAFEKGFNKEDFEVAAKKGISMAGLLGGAWLAGPGGVKKFLYDNVDSSDKSWSKDGKTGSKVSDAIKRYNNYV